MMPCSLCKSLGALKAALSCDAFQPDNKTVVQCDQDMKLSRIIKGSNTPQAVLG